MDINLLSVPLINVWHNKSLIQMVLVNIAHTDGTFLAVESIALNQLQKNKILSSL